MSVQQKRCYSVLNDLSSALNEWFPCELRNFGSSVTGLGFKNSDIDVYVKLLPPRPYSHNETMDYLKRTKRILMRHPSFKKVFGVFGAKTPIIKCEHTPTGLNCDINLKNSLGIYNSELLSYLQTLDIRIKPLLLVIKCWAQNLNLTGSNKITSYALAMMIIFYLQQKKILPPIRFLQSCAFDHDEWNCTFDKEKGHTFEIENNQNLFELLRDFYRFYEAFNFKEIISPLTGITHQRHDFTKSGNIPFEYERYKLKLEQSGGSALKLESSIIVIDPFELSHNITPCANANILQLFKEACILSAKCFNIGADCKECEVLSKLFTIKISLKKNKIIREYECNILASDDLSFQEEASVKDTTGLHDLRKNWLHRAKDLVLKIMQEILLLDVQDITVSPDRKSIKTETKDEVHSSNITETIKYHCTTKMSVLRGRYKCKVVKANLTKFEHEKAITRGILDDSGSKSPKNMADFYMTITSVLQPTKITIKLTNNIAINSEFMLITDYCKKNLKKLCVVAIEDNDINKSEPTEIKLMEGERRHLENQNQPSTSSQNGNYAKKLNKKIEIRHDVVPPGFVPF